MSAFRPLPHVIVVGAGIVGAAAAFYLARIGARVTVIESETAAAGASGASDGAVSVASKRPGPMMRLAREARALYQSLAADGAMAGIFTTRPTYLFARSEQELSLLETHRRDLCAEGEYVHTLSRSDLDRQIPGLGASVLGGLMVPHDGHAIGYQVVNRLLSLSNVVPERYCPVRNLVLQGDRVTGVQTDRGVVDADMVVLAAGLGSAPLAGLQDILIPRKGQLVVTDRACANGSALPGSLMSAAYLAAKRDSSGQNSSISLVIDPLKTGQFLIGSSRENGLSDRQTDVKTTSTILREALEVYPALARQRVIRTFAGIRTATRDGTPIVGHHPFLQGLVIATGFEGDGICLGPLMGAAAARLACGLDSGMDLSALSPARFGRLNLQ